MGTTFVQAFIAPDAVVEQRRPTAYPVFRIGDVTMFLEGTPEAASRLLDRIAAVALEARCRLDAESAASAPTAAPETDAAEAVAA